MIWRFNVCHCAGLHVRCYSLLFGVNIYRRVVNRFEVDLYVVFGEDSSEYLRHFYHTRNDNILVPFFSSGCCSICFPESLTDSSKAQFGNPQVGRTVLMCSGSFSLFLMEIFSVRWCNVLTDSSGSRNWFVCVQTSALLDMQGTVEKCQLVVLWIFSVNLMLLPTDLTCPVKVSTSLFGILSQLSFTYLNQWLEVVPVQELRGLLSTTSM